MVVCIITKYNTQIRKIAQRVSMYIIIAWRSCPALACEADKWEKSHVVVPKNYVPED